METILPPEAFVPFEEALAAHQCDEMSILYRGGIISPTIMSKVQCVFRFESCTTERRGGEKRGELKF